MMHPTVGTNRSTVRRHMQHRALLLQGNRMRLPCCCSTPTCACGSTSAVPPRPFVRAAPAASRTPGGGRSRSVSRSVTRCARPIVVCGTFSRSPTYRPALTLPRSASVSWTTLASRRASVRWGDGGIDWDGRRGVGMCRFRPSSPTLARAPQHGLGRSRCGIIGRQRRHGVVMRLVAPDELEAWLDKLDDERWVRCSRSPKTCSRSWRRRRNASTSRI